MRGSPSFVRRSRSPLSRDFSKQSCVNEAFDSGKNDSLNKCFLSHSQLQFEINLFRFRSPFLFASILSLPRFVTRLCVGNAFHVAREQRQISRIYTLHQHRSRCTAKNLRNEFFRWNVMKNEIACRPISTSHYLDFICLFQLARNQLSDSGTQCFSTSDVIRVSTSKFGILNTGTRHLHGDYYQKSKHFEAASLLNDTNNFRVKYK